MGSGTAVYRQALSRFFKNYGPTILAHYVQAPIGIVVVLFFAFLVDMLIDLMPFTFPAQAICMVLLFGLMTILHEASPHFLFHHFHRFLHPAAEFLLASMGLFFTSSFILIPRRDPIPPREIGLIVALFLPSFLVTWVGTVALCKVIGTIWPQAVDKEEEDNNADVLEEESEKSSIRSVRRQPTISDVTLPHGNSALTLAQEDDEIMVCEDQHSRLSSRRKNSSSSPTPPRTAHHNELALEINPTLTMNDSQYAGGHQTASDLEQQAISTSEKKPGLVAKGIAIVKHSARGPSEPVTGEPEDLLALKFEKWFDPAVYFLVFLIGIPLFYSPGGETRSLPLCTGVVAMAWLFSRRIVPQTWQKLLHPILVTSFITVLVVWGLGAIKGLTLTEVLNHYSTGANYLVLFRRGQGWDGSSPSAGDLLNSLLVGGIVVLAFPLFRYRADLYHNFCRLILVVTPNCVLALLFWPWLAHVMGLNGERAVTFAGRFMSTPFGIQLLVATGGDNSLVVVLICVTGIFAVLIRDLLFKLCRTSTTVGSDEYFTIGCTIGVIAGAIGTSSLMGSHSRAAATATVMFVLYGLILLALVAVPTIADFVGRLAGL